MKILAINPNIKSHLWDIHFGKGFILFMIFGILSCILANLFKETNDIFIIFIILDIFFIGMAITNGILKKIKNCVLFAIFGGLLITITYFSKNLPSGIINFDFIPINLSLSILLFNIQVSEIYGLFLILAIYLLINSILAIFHGVFGDLMIFLFNFFFMLFLFFPFAWLQLTVNIGESYFQLKVDLIFPMLLLIGIMSIRLVFNILKYFAEDYEEYYHDKHEKKIPSPSYESKESKIKTKKTDGMEMNTQNLSQVIQSVIHEDNANTYLLDNSRIIPNKIRIKKRNL